jgi:hypothetical protein
MFGISEMGRDEYRNGNSAPFFFSDNHSEEVPNEERQTLLQKYNDFAFRDPQAVWVICGVSGPILRRLFR